MTVRVGVIGCGWWATRAHLPALATEPDAVIAAISDPDRDNLRRAGDAFGVAARFADAEAMLSAVDLDAAIIAGPHDTHASLVAMCLDARLHVLVEKPMTTDPADAADLVARAASVGRELIVGYPYHYVPAYRALRDQIADGALGRLELVTGLFASVVRELYRGRPEPYRETLGYTFNTPGAGTYSRPGDGGGGQAHTQVTHLAALLLWLTGLRPVTVSAVTATTGLAVDLVDALAIRFEEGVVGSLASTGGVQPTQEELLELRLFGDGGHVLLDASAGRMSSHLQGGQIESAPVIPAAERYPEGAPARNLVGVAMGRETNGSPGTLGAAGRGSHRCHPSCRGVANGGRRVVHEPCSSDTTNGGAPMRIDRVQAFAVRYPEPNNDGKIRSLTLVRIETVDGVVGWGEAITGAQEVSLATAFMVERRLAPIVIGRDSRDVAGAWAAMRDATYWDGNGGIVTFGISAIDMALWDIVGKIAGRPLHTLLSDRPRVPLEACASTILATGDLDRIGREFAWYVAQGYRYVKGGWGHDLSIAFGRADARDLAVARAVREAVGQTTEVILDVVALAGWDAAHAIRMCRALDDVARLFWLEDPLPEQDIEGYRALRDAVGTRICTGEKGWHAAHYRSLIESRAIDVIMLDPGKAEGISGAWGVIGMAAAAGLWWNAHSWSSALNTAASLHLATAAPNTLLFELKPLPSPMQDELVRNPIHAMDGRVLAPLGPGLGVDVDEAVVRGYAFAEDDLGR